MENNIENNIVVVQSEEKAVNLAEVAAKLNDDYGKLRRGEISIREAIARTNMVNAITKTIFLSHATKTTGHATRLIDDDQLSDFVSECCEVSKGANTFLKDLYKEYTDWISENGHSPIYRSDKKFLAALLTLPYLKRFTNRNNRAVVSGIKLIKHKLTV